MTHRERVMAAVSYRQPDRVPIDFGGTRDSTIVVEGYERLKKHFGVVIKNQGEGRSILQSVNTICAFIEKSVRKRVVWGPLPNGSWESLPSFFLRSS